MSNPCSNIEHLHPASRASFAELRTAEQITAETLAGLKPVELYAAISEHWGKCTGCAKAALKQCPHTLIRNHAHAMSSLFDEQQAAAVA